MPSLSEWPCPLEVVGGTRPSRHCCSPSRPPPPPPTRPWPCLTSSCHCRPRRRPRTADPPSHHQQAWFSEAPPLGSSSDRPPMPPPSRRSCQVRLSPFISSSLSVLISPATSFVCQWKASAHDRRRLLQQLIAMSACTQPPARPLVQRWPGRRLPLHVASSSSSCIYETWYYL